MLPLPCCQYHQMCVYIYIYIYIYIHTSPIILSNFVLSASPNVLLYRVLFYQKPCCQYLQILALSPVGTFRTHRTAPGITPAPPPYHLCSQIVPRDNGLIPTTNSALTPMTRKIASLQAPLSQA